MLGRLFGRSDERRTDVATVVRRLHFGLKFLLQSARMIHGAFNVPAPQLEEF
jgi:hypothetical protein